MAIEVRCLSCLAPYSLAESMRGKKVRCKQCSNVFVVDDTPAEAPVLEAEEEEEIPVGELITAAPIPKSSRSKIKEEPRSRRRDRDEEDDDDDFPRKRRSRSDAGSNTTLIVVLSCVGGGVLLLLLGVGGWLAFSASSRPGPVVVAPQPAFPNPPVFNQPWPNVNPPVVNPNPPPVVVPWRVTVDASAQQLKPPADPGQTLPVPLAAQVLFSTRASPFVAIGNNRNARDVRQIWNLETMQQAGTISGRLSWQRDPTALSPDGKYLAGKAIGGGTVVEVYAVATGQKVQRIQVDPGLPTLSLLDFAGPHQLVTLKTVQVGIKQIVQGQVWDINTGNVLHQFDLTAAPFDARSCALSPNGKFLAVIDANGKLAVYDQVQGSLAGTFDPPKPPGVIARICKGVAFSPDGVELAAIYDSGGVGIPQVIVWNVAKGTVSRSVTFLNGALQKAQGALIYSGSGLVWFPDGSGWLLLGYYVFDAAKGDVVWTVPDNLETGFVSHRRMIGRDLLVAVESAGPNRALKFIPVPRK